MGISLSPEPGLVYLCNRCVFMVIGLYSSKIESFQSRVFFGVQRCTKCGPSGKLSLENCDHCSKCLPTTVFHSSLTVSLGCCV